MTGGVGATFAAAGCPHPLPHHAGIFFGLNDFLRESAETAEKPRHNWTRARFNLVRTSTSANREHSGSYASGQATRAFGARTRSGTHRGRCVPSLQKSKALQTLSWPAPRTGLISKNKGPQFALVRTCEPTAILHPRSAPDGP